MDRKGWTRLLLGAACGLATVLGSSCGPRGEAPVDAGASLPTTRWTAASDAASYRVRGWSGSVLLFEVNTIADSLPWTPSLRRAADAFDTVVVRIHPLDAAERPVGLVQEIRIRP